MNNPIEMIKVLMSGNKNPQQIAMNMIGKSNPMLSNLMQMANTGNTKGVETFARNLCKERGINYDKEFSEFMKQIK